MGATHTWVPLPHCCIVFALSYMGATWMGATFTVAPFQMWIGPRGLVSYRERLSRSDSQLESFRA